MRSTIGLACVALMLSTCTVGLYAADTKPKPSRRVKKATKEAPKLRKMSDSEKKAALREQAQKLKERWARSAAENAARAAEESARAAKEVLQLREEIVRLRQELAQVREAMQKREADDADARDVEEAKPEPKTKPKKVEPEKVAKAKVEPDARVEPAPKPEAKPKEDPEPEVKEKPKAEKKEEEVLSEDLQALVKQIDRTGDVKPPKKPVTWATVDLSELFNNDGISGDENRRDSDFDEYRQAYAAELLPEPGLVKPLGHMPDLPFIFPPKKEGAKNNVACAGQRIAVPQGRYAALYVMGSATFGEQKGEAKLECEKGEMTATLKLSDWCSASKFGEAQAYLMTSRHNWEGKEEKAVCSIWVQAIELPADRTLEAIVLPENPKIHIFAMTLAKVQ